MNKRKVTWYNVDVIFYRLASKDHRDRKKDKDHKSIHFGKYVKFTTWNLNVTVNGKFALPVNELIHFETAEGKVEFQQGLNIFVSDSDFEKWYSALTYPFDAYYITKMKATDDTKAKKYSPLDEGLKDASKIAMNSKYMHTTLDLDCCTFANAIKNKMYIENDCLINSIIDFYPNKFTRGKILEALGKSEDEVKNGFSVNDVIPFFLKYNLQIRVYDSMYDCIYKHDSQNRNHNYKTMFVMVEGDHVYTLNDELSALQQLVNTDRSVAVTASTDFHLNDEKEKCEYKMITGVDDILQIVKEMQTQIDMNKKKKKKKKKIVVNIIIKPIT